MKSYPQSHKSPHALVGSDGLYQRPKSTESIESTGIIPEILTCVLSIIHDSPGSVIDPKFNLGDDEKELDAYFRRYNSICITFV